MHRVRVVWTTKYFANGTRFAGVSDLMLRAHGLRALIGEGRRVRTPFGGHHLASEPISLLVRWDSRVTFQAVYGPYTMTCSANKLAVAYTRDSSRPSTSISPALTDGKSSRRPGTRGKPMNAIKNQRSTAAALVAVQLWLVVTLGSSIAADTVADWQDQARLVCTVPGLRGTHAQLLVGAGYRSADALAGAEADKLCADVLAFAATRDGQRALRNGDPPDIERIKAWLEAARSVRAA